MQSWDRLGFCTQPRARTPPKPTPATTQVSASETPFSCSQEPIASVSCAPFWCPKRTSYPWRIYPEKTKTTHDTTLPKPLPTGTDVRQSIYEQILTYKCDCLSSYQHHDFKYVLTCEANFDPIRTWLIWPLSARYLPNNFCWSIQLSCRLVN